MTPVDLDQEVKDVLAQIPRIADTDDDVQRVADMLRRYAALLTPPTPEPWEAVKGLCDKATPGPWKTLGGEVTPALYVWTEDESAYIASCWVSDPVEHADALADAAFIAAARTALPDAIAEIARLTATIEEWKAIANANYDNGLKLSQSLAASEARWKEQDAEITRLQDGWSDAANEREVLRVERDKARDAHATLCPYNTALTAERAKVQALREWHKNWIVMHRRGSQPENALTHRVALERMDELSLTGGTP